MVWNFPGLVSRRTHRFTNEETTRCISILTSTFKTLHSTENIENNTKNNKNPSITLKI